MSETRQEYVETDRWSTELAAFGRFMDYQGRSAKTIRSYTLYARRCLSILGDSFTPGRRDPSWEDRLREAFSDVDPRSATNYIGAWKQFLRSLDAVECDEADGVPYHLSTDFDDDLDSFKKRLGESGMSEIMITKNIRYVRHCWRLMAEHIGDVCPEDIDAELVREVETFMPDISDNARGNNLRALGKFVCSVTGANPYEDLTAPVSSKELMPRIHDLVKDDRFGKAIMEYAMHMRRIGNKDVSVMTSVHHIRGCLSRLEGSEWNVELEYIDREAFIYLYQEFLSLNETTSRTYLTDFGRFLEFVTGKNHMKGSGLVWNHPTTVVDRLFPDEFDYRRLLENATPEEELVVRLAGEMGLRRTEISHIRLDDVRDDVIVVHGKGRGPRGYTSSPIVPKTVKEAIERYMPFRDNVIRVHGDRSNGNLLVRCRQRAGEAAPPDQVSEIIERLSRRTGVDVTPHALRRYYANSLLENGYSLLEIKELMRHAHFETTASCYLNTSMENLISKRDVLGTAIRL